MTFKMVFITTVFLGSLAAFIMGLRRNNLLKLDLDAIKEATGITKSEIMVLGRRALEIFE
ncbi:ECU02_0885 [Encephalitozoon cuniculi GB-M1]|uniref:ECU02_0885 protein n=1 Tax=Encephalitozoon cuniculi (strain GB-M1) TaxID=284813 RepID=A0A1T5PCZ1_ENCCU|nr:uncharacterized protein ECU02_0885 [Encephalitozoon cuniculi GB-M1]UYI28281.1 hypothetical protein J0A71_10g21860 [Encephalitozoon cuniculi]SKD10684.1 ECU02_0885 [Encephalitozoon cuniculi GB-M1]